jgi:cytochrome oxidase Cu insertion factor (SCO1/SenC/PrrC family)
MTRFARWSFRIVVLGIVVAGCAFSGKQSSGPPVGSVAPEIAAVDQDGKEFKLSDYRGKVVLLDFWFST